MPGNETRPFPAELLKARFQDYALSAALLCASFFWLAAPSGAGGEAASSAVLRHRGEVLAELPLDRSSKRVFSLDAGRIEVEVVPGKGVHISDSNCPAKVCMHHGWASGAGETIACLPNKLLLEIEGGDSEYDAVIR